MAKTLYWLSDDEWAAIQPHLPTGRRGARQAADPIADRRLRSNLPRGAGDLRHFAYVANGSAIARLPVGIWSLHDTLQPLQPMVQARRMGGCFLCYFRLFRRRGHHQRRQYIGQGAPLGIGRSSAENRH